MELKNKPYTSEQLRKRTDRLRNRIFELVDDFIDDTGVVAVCGAIGYSTVSDFQDEHGVDVQGEDGTISVQILITEE